MLGGVLAAGVVLLLAEVLRAVTGGEAGPRERVLDSDFAQRFARKAGPSTEGVAVTGPLGRLESWLSRLPGYGKDGRLHAGHVQATCFLSATLVFYLLPFWLLRPDRPDGRSLPALLYVLLVLVALAWLLPGGSRRSRRRASTVWRGAGCSWS